jgi:very-short-patch-repair endonuclease
MTDLFNKSSMKEIRRGLRQASTESEALLWEELRGRKFLGVKFKRQFSIGSFVVDFYCSSHELIIEVDGSVHEDPVVQQNDKDRQEALESLGLSMLRVTNHDVMNNMDDVLTKIKMRLNVNA